MRDIYQGDPLIVIDEDGADLEMGGTAAQPTMDQGVENLVTLSLLTESGWEGNFYLSSPSEKFTGSFLKKTKLPITIKNLEVVRKAIIDDLKINPAIGGVSVTTTSTRSNTYSNKIIVSPPRQTVQELTITTNGINWIKQAEK